MRSVREWADLFLSDARVPKPRTNADAVNFWAAHALVDDSQANSGDTNSIVITRDVVYSFGMHYPMGRIARNVHGRCVEIILNADYYPCRGFASTPNDQWNVKIAAEDVRKLDPRITVRTVWLSSYNLPHGIQIQPRANDPEPPARVQREVPKRFTAFEPGPEPVDRESHLCVAGRVEEYSYQDDHMLIGDYRGRGIVVRKGRWLYERKSYNGTIVWGSEPHRPHQDRVTYKQCPHCATFQLRHRIWTVLMRGGYHPQTYKKVKGWDSYQAQLHAHGGWEGWLEAWRADNRRVSEAREAREQWVKRNHIPLDYCSRDAHNVPRLTKDGYALRKDESRYFHERRAILRMQRKAQREAEEAARYRRQVERFKSRVRARREAAHARTFEGTVQRVVSELRVIRESYHAIPELPSNESLED